MFKFKHVPLTIYTNADAEQMRKMFKEQKENIIAAAFDTETTGLNPVLDKPFLYQFGWLNIAEETIYSFVVDLERQPLLSTQVIKVWQILVREIPKYCGHHVVFDLHMITNIGLPYEEDNITDTMAYIRLATDAIQTAKGGAPLALKQFCTKYIDPSAKDQESKLDAERSAIASSYNNKLKQALGWTKKKIDTFFNDKLNEYADLPEDKQQAYISWKTDLPLYLQDKVTGAVDKDMIRYDTLDRNNVIEYGHGDIRLTLEAWWLLSNALEVRGNQVALKIEEENIYPLYRMERVGLVVDIPYLMQAKEDVKKYIRERRQDLQNLAGVEVSVGQHALIKELLNNMGVHVAASNNDELESVLSELKRSGDNQVAIDFIENVQELRTLEKWYSTYICRFLYDLKYTDRIYTNINAYGAVSGRVTCDFQQFPKKAIVTIDGRELFHPRKMIKVSEDSLATVYLDYSQVELRLQAMYTILVGHPDLNLCRAYMPYQCHTAEGTQYEYDAPWCKQHAYDMDWFYNEDPSRKWTPLDVHGATTKAAFNITEEHPDFHALRYVGKRVNFAKNYGAQRGKIREMFPEFDDAQVDKINDAYYIAFPGVKKYHDYCYAIANQPCAMNLFGVKYWGVSGHNLCNMLVQGSGAYLLKTKINQVDALLKGHKSRLQMQIHDELMFEWDESDPPELWFEIKALLQNWEDTLVPIVSDMEVTFTNWGEKFEIADIEQLKGEYDAHKVCNRS